MKRVLLHATGFLVAGLLTATALATAYAGTASVCGDVNGNGTITASDALSVLRKAVGQTVDLFCAGAGQPLKTGQTICFDASGTMNAVIDCAGTGQDGEFQAGVARSFTDNGDGTITDSTTGLVWEKLSDDGSIHDKDNTYSWSNAFVVKVAALNTGSFAGHNDWRLPNRLELETLLHLGTAQPASYPEFDAGCVPDCTVLTCSCNPTGAAQVIFWSSSSYAVASSNAWVVNFSDGHVYPDVKFLGYQVRAVRGGSGS